MSGWRPKVRADADDALCHCDKGKQMRPLILALLLLATPLVQAKKGDLCYVEKCFRETGYGYKPLCRDYEQLYYEGTICQEYVANKRYCDNLKENLEQACGCAKMCKEKADCRVKDAATNVCVRDFFWRD